MSDITPADALRELGDDQAEYAAAAAKKAGPRGETLETIARVLGEHRRGDWSDRTYACAGCRASAEGVPVPDDETPEQRRARWEKHQEIIYPGWSFADYNAHVADHMLAALAQLRVPAKDRTC